MYDVVYLFDDKLQKGLGRNGRMEDAPRKVDRVKGKPRKVDKVKGRW